MAEAGGREEKEAVKNKRGDVKKPEEQRRYL
jgi:hypothetical protein